MLFPDLPTAFVDIETTGGRSGLHRITEVAVVTADEHGATTEWSTLINPEVSIPRQISALTGIDNDMVADAPTFEDLHDELRRRLDGHLFVAHNVQFDYGFLRRAFAGLGTRFQPRTLCTVLLSRALYPAQRRHNLSALIERHGLACERRHRALDDARALRQWCDAVAADLGKGALLDAVSAQLAGPRLPQGVSPESIDALPDRPGIYLLYGEDDVLLYVGKSVRLRARVLAHFSAASRDTRENKLFAQTRDVRHIETAGELGALLLEARWVKRHSPLFNRRLRPHRSLFAIEICGDPADYLQARVVDSGDPESQPDANWYGMFRSRRAALGFLRSAAEEHYLCRKRLGLERGGGSCFAWQLGRCKGACVGRQAAVAFNNQLLNALAISRHEAWPFDGPVAIRERSARRSELHLLDRWRYLGSASSLDELEELAGSDAPFDLDIYRILSRHLKRKIAKSDIVTIANAAGDGR